MSDRSIDEPDSLVGRVLAERYVVEGVIAEGGMGRVYRGTQRIGNLTRAVAIKVLHEELCLDPSLRRRFHRECEVVVSLTHANTIRFHDFGELDDGRLFIVMEYVDGRSLSRVLLREGPLPAGRVERILDQIAGSIDEAHQRGVVHRDLKPDNILLTTLAGQDDFVKVLDFGIAKRTDGAESSVLTLAGTFVGTPEYMSPEQITGGTVDARSDVFSLGLIVYELLTGAPPYEGSSAIEWATHHSATEPASFDDFEATRALAPHRRAAVRAALEKRPRDRPATARAFAAAFAGRGSGEELPPFGPRAAAPAAPRALAAVTAPTLDIPEGVVRRRAGTPARSDEPVRSDEDGLPRARWISPRTLAVGLAGVGFVGLGAALVVFVWPPTGASPSAPVAVDAGFADAGFDAGTDAGPTVREPAAWAAETSAATRVDQSARAHGAPDGRVAIVGATGAITLQLAERRAIEADGTPAPDLRIVAQPGTLYRVEIGAALARMKVVASPVEGIHELDLDAFPDRVVRYVRVSNRGTGTLSLDAVGAYTPSRAP